MKIKIRSNLPIKYYLGIQFEDKLIDEKTILFDILQYLVKVLESKEKEISYQSLKFSSKSLKYVFGDKIEEETFKNKLVQSLKKSISDGFLKNDSSFMYFTEKGLTAFYNVE